MTVYGEDGGWLHDGAPVGGSELEKPLLVGTVFSGLILRSGFALRDDDLWKRAVQRELAEYHQVDVASLPQDPIAGFVRSHR
jgi:hypothetical protein